MYRLVIDVTIEEDLEQSIKIAQELLRSVSSGILSDLQNKVLTVDKSIIHQFQYRLSRDEDRTVRNYLNLDQEGHASTKKTKMF